MRFLAIGQSPKPPMDPAMSLDENSNYVKSEHCYFVMNMKESKRQGDSLKRILILCWMDPKNTQSGGDVRYCYEMAKRLVKDGHSVTWFSSSSSDLPDTDCMDGISIRRRGEHIYSLYLRLTIFYFDGEKV